MAITPVKKIRSQDPEIERLQSAFEIPIKEISAKALIDGLLLLNISLKTGVTNAVNHKLSRNLVGYIVIGNSANSIVYDSQSSNTAKDKTLNLLCSANTTVNLWVF